MREEDTPISEAHLIEIELSAHGIINQDDKSSHFDIDEEGRFTTVLLENLSMCENTIRELKEELWNGWKMIGHLSDIIISSPEYNETSCFENILFLNYVKKIYLFSLVFDELEDVSHKLKAVFNCDIVNIDENIVQDFNEQYIEIKVLHNILMKELYIQNLIKRYLSFKNVKIASVQGPWGNLDLPMKERQWEWYDDGEEAYQRERTETKQKQTRYNKEDNFFGIFFSWEDLRRSPYSWDTRKQNSDYPIRDQISIP